jgi:hypothetical protein
MYVPYAQAPNVEARPTIVLRTSVEPLSIALPLSQTVAEIDRAVPIDRAEAIGLDSMKTLTESVRFWK